MFHPDNSIWSWKHSFQLGTTDNVYVMKNNCCIFNEFLKYQRMKFSFLEYLFSF